MAKDRLLCGRHRSRRQQSAYPLRSSREVRSALNRSVRPGKKAALQSFFKTGPGEYAEGDVFLGVMVPDIRKIVKACIGMPLDETLRLVKSPVHEERLAGLIIMVEAFKRSDSAGRKMVFDAYLSHLDHVNNWDLVDLTAPHIVGRYLEETSHGILLDLARSDDLWRRRVSIIATFHFIRLGRFAETLKIVRMLLRDPEDLIHKASGWMLREVGKRDMAALTGFLDKHSGEMPRTMLRYAIERLSPKDRAYYMKRKG